VKRLLRVCLAGLAFGACAMAQETTSFASSGTSQQGLGQRTIVGCLARTGGKYLIAGGGPGPVNTASSLVTSPL